ncbi:hypothetical protein [Thioclava kandeliae]|uniref:DUF2946 domain-containing protein n=1 Tax=Thioclava kandeliae TaxID=3070818 RepID=A0ABV1SK32_9RHOB
MTVRMPTFAALILGLCLAWASVLSAAMMAPTQDSLAREAHALLHDPLAGGICGETPHGAGYHCPFCHSLPDVPRPEFVTVEGRFVAQDRWRAGEGLRGTGSAQRSAHGIRAPPGSV